MTTASRDHATTTRPAVPAGGAAGTAPTGGTGGAAATIGPASVGTGGAGTGGGRTRHDGPRRPFDPRLFTVVPSARGPVLAVAGVGFVRGVVAIGQALAVAALVVAVAEASPVGGPVVAVGVTFAARAAVEAVATLVGSWAADRVSSGLRRRLLGAVLAAPADRRPDPATLELLLDRTPADVEPWVARYLPALVQAAVLPLAAIATMAWLDWRIALVPLLTVPLLPLFAALIGAATADETERRWQALERLSGHFLDIMQGMVVLVGYGRGPAQVDQVRRVGERLRVATVATLRTAFLSAAALELLASISVAIVAVFVGLALASGAMPLAVGLPLILLAPEAYWPVRRVGVEFHAAADGTAAIDRIVAVVDAATGRATAPADRSGDHAREDARPADPQHAPASAPAVRLVDLAVGHADTVLVEDLSLVPEIGLTVVTGPSGVGKTTLLEVVAGLRRPLAGRVDAPHGHLVGQRPLLVPGDLRTNLVLAGRGRDGAGRDGAGRDGDGRGEDDGDDGDDDLLAALAAVGLAGWVAGLPDGLRTRVGSDGVGLSAGQRVRVAVARALVADPDVVLLDEPTAHLDGAGRAAVLGAVDVLARDRVVVVASHDPAVVARADHHLDLARAADVVTTGPAVPAATAPTEADARGATAVDRARPGAGRTGRPGRAVPAPDDRSGRDPDPRGSEDALAAAAPTWPLAVWSAGTIGGLARACGVALTATSGWLVVAASLEPEILLLLVAIVAVRAFGIARPVLRWWERVRSHDHAMADLARRRERVWAGLLPLAPARLGTHGRGRVLAGVVDDLDEVVQGQVRVAVPTVAMGVACVVGMGVAALGLPAAVPVVGGFVLGLLLVGVAGERAEAAVLADLLAARAAVTDVAVLVAGRATDLAGVGAAPQLDRRLRRVHDRLGAARRRRARVRAVAAGAVPALVGLALVVLAGVVVAAVVDGLTTPVATLVLLVPLGLGEAVGADVAEVAGSRAGVVVASRRLRDLLGREPAVTDPDDPVALPPGPLDRALVAATARWDRARAPVPLPGLRLRAGDRVGLVGGNGSGKSTTLAVLARHLDPAAGRHVVGGLDATTVAVDDVRSRLAMVDDDPHVFASTLRENLRLARPPASDDACREALVRAGLGAFLAGLPDGLDTRLGAGGRGCSGGERARLALARAVLADREVLVLDEPVAHLDHPTALAVMGDVLGAAGDRTVLVAMHRPEGLDALDRVVSLGDAPGSADVGAEPTGLARRPTT